MDPNVHRVSLVSPLESADGRIATEPWGARAPGRHVGPRQEDFLMEG